VKGVKGVVCVVCVGCVGCAGCAGCEGCAGCVGCVGCAGCVGCVGCVGGTCLPRTRIAISRMKRMPRSSLRFRGEGSEVQNNYFTEMCSGSEAGSYLRPIDFVYHSTLGVRVIKKKFGG